MKKHTALKNKIAKMLKAEFPDAWVYFASDIWKSAIPDILICYIGKFIAIEIKVPPDDLTPLQRYTLEQIQRAGGVAEKVYAVVDVRKIMLDMKSN